MNFGDRFFRKVHDIMNKSTAYDSVGEGFLPVMERNHGPTGRIDNNQVSLPNHGKKQANQQGIMNLLDNNIVNLNKAELLATEEMKQKDKRK